MIEAVDASFAIGFVKIVFDNFFLKPAPPNIKKIFSKFGKHAARHWFKHAKVIDLMNVKIYDFVRERIGTGFRSDFINTTEGLVISRPVVVVIAYYVNDNRKRIIWG